LIKPPGGTIFALNRCFLVAIETYEDVMGERVKTKTEPKPPESEFADLLESELAGSFPASDPPSLIQPHGADWSEEEEKNTKLSETLIRQPLA
jgi:hypothetical protein